MIRAARRRKGRQDTNTISLFPASVMIIISEESQTSFALICNGAKLWARHSSAVAVM